VVPLLKGTKHPSPLVESIVHRAQGARNDLAPL
jgi:hypothetical protein